MTDLPKLIWVWNVDKYGDRQAGRWVGADSFVQSDTDIEYVRKDISNELAKVLKVIVKHGDEGMDGEYFKAEMTEKARAALTKYAALAKYKEPET